MAAYVSDLDLIHASQGGNQSAYGELVYRYREAVVAVVYRMCGDLSTAEEAAQEAFLRAWQHLGGYRPEYPFRSWVFRIAVNAALDALRREKPQADLEEVETSLSLAHHGGPDPETVVVARQRSDLIRKAVLALPPPYRAALVLREFGGLSYAEIAAALEIPLGTVMSRLNTARSQLGQALAGVMEAL
ncbi:MAG TPA: RNA polymerase sigma factor [Anaerolineaceae bacterium]|nr:RNA polymerase sigma factor [Anaerolineaceae bacterium]